MKKLILGIALIISAMLHITPEFLGGLPVTIGLIFTYFGIVNVIENYQKH